jgi:hypothetical protein
MDLPVFRLAVDAIGAPPWINQLSPRSFNAIQGIEGRGASTWDVSAACHAAGINVALEVARRREGYNPSATQLACAAGHRLIYRAITREQHTVALVLEEDALPVRGFVDLAPALDKLTTPTPTIVQLSCRGEVFPESPSCETQVTPALVPLRYPPRQTTAYLINHAAAALGSTSVLDGLADWPGFATHVDFWAMLPWPFVEASRSSTIQLGWEARGDIRAPRLRSVIPRSLDDIYRKTLPRVDSKLWRMRGMQRVGPQGELWMPSLPGFVPTMARKLARRSRRHY